jgi:hypothetical protein
MGVPKPKAGKQVSRAAQTLRILLRPQNRGLVLTVVVLVATIAGWLYAWQRWGGLSGDSAEHVVTAEQIYVTPPPEWVHSDVKTEVLRAAGLVQLDLRDPQLVSNVAAAFALHPWVAKVTRVRKHVPPRVDVDIEYRRPVAAVEVTARNEPGLLFVDAYGVLLPSADFAQRQAKDFLRISAGTETPAGVYGTPWGSERIAGAAAIAAAWEGGQEKGDRGQKTGDSVQRKRWQQLELYRIVPVQIPGGEFVYELRTQAGARVIWGAAPGSESTPEPSPDLKIAALENYVADKGPLDREGAPPQLDLRK